MRKLARDFGLVCMVAVSFPALAQSEAPAACALREPQAPRPAGFGVVIGLQSPARARLGIRAREAQRGGTIDPRYRDDLRATVRQDNGVVDNFDVLPGTAVRAGDRVRLQGSFRGAASSCFYVPHMAIPDDAPSV